MKEKKIRIALSQIISGSFLVILGLFFSCKTTENAQKETTAVQYTLLRENIRIRDPFIFTDKKKGVYYMYANDNPRIKVFESKDLEHWIDCGAAFTADEEFWGKKDFWAPDLYAYHGKYYLFVTFSDSEEKRGTSILVSDNPKGPFRALENRPVTPKEWMCLDGSLYIDEEKNPWLLYCHEWVEVGDGEVVAQQLTSDLRSVKGEPIILFRASEAPWSDSICKEKERPCYVTDAPFIYRLKNGTLLMTWSSFRKDGKYAIGQAISESGSVLGPWEQLPETLNNDDGGHAMLFEDLGGRLKISYHAPNSNQERAVFRDVQIDGTQIKLK